LYPLSLCHALSFFILSIDLPFVVLVFYYVLQTPCNRSHSILLFIRLFLQVVPITSHTTKHITHCISPTILHPHLDVFAFNQSTPLHIHLAHHHSHIESTPRHTLLPICHLSLHVTYTHHHYHHECLSPTWQPCLLVGRKWQCHI